MNQQPGQEQERTPHKPRGVAVKGGNGADPPAIPPVVEELATLFPAAHTVVIAGRSIEMKRPGLGQSGRIISASMPLYALYVERGTELVSLIEDEPQAINTLIVAATGLDAEWVSSLQPENKLDLINEWLEVHGDFFVQFQLQRVARLGIAIERAFGVGRTSSTS